MLTEIIIAIVGLSVFVFIANAIAPSLKDHEACKPEDKSKGDMFSLWLLEDEDKPQQPWYGDKNG